MWPTCLRKINHRCLSQSDNLIFLMIGSGNGMTQHSTLTLTQEYYSCIPENSMIPHLYFTGYKALEKIAQKWLCMFVRSSFTPWTRHCKLATFPLTWNVIAFETLWFLKGCYCYLAEKVSLDFTSLRSKGGIFFFAILRFKFFFFQRRCLLTLRSRVLLRPLWGK